ncbi:MAG: hypothetical protein M1464_01870 [Candidatus Thermoplasmatota archaeon]|jgi:predicted solute-binding protein|nr:hypothetical protein [Candidatus Thermoplasmatota archaeon]
MRLDWTFLKMSHSDPLVMAYKVGTMERASPSDSLANVLDMRSKMSMVSLVSYLRNAKDLFLLREPVISFAGQTLSTLLVSRDKGMQKNMEIAISADTETTRWYMSNVLRSMGVRFTLKSSGYIEAEELLNEADYALVIGDEALKVFSTKFRILIDVGYEFLRIFEMFPLYAVSVAREENLDISRDWISDANNYKEECAEKLASRLGISTVLTRRYYENVMYLAESSTENTLSFVRNGFTT